jgi:hypothetical protein
VDEDDPSGRRTEVSEHQISTTLASRMRIHLDICQSQLKDEAMRSVGSHTLLFYPTVDFVFEQFATNDFCGSILKELLSIIYSSYAVSLPATYISWPYLHKWRPAR